MKITKLSKLENNYYYGISRYFWHAIIGLAILGFFVGIAMFAWSKIPPSKPHVVKSKKPFKPAYPEVKPVSIESLLNSLPKKQKTKQNNVEIVDDEDLYQTTDTQEIEIVETIDSVALALFERTLGETKNLISQEKYKLFWEGKKNLVYNSARDEKMFKKTKNPKYAPKWVSLKSHPSFKNKYLSVTKKIKNYRQKAKLLNSYNTIIQNVPVGKRTYFMNRFLTDKITPYNLDEIAQTNTTIAPVLSKIDSINQPKTYNRLFSFVKRNPNDGPRLSLYLEKILNSFKVNARPYVLKYIFREYAENYNNNLVSLKEATNQFLPYLKKINIDQQDLALKVFYNLYRKNNINRDKSVKQIDYNYNQTIAEWKSTYQQQLNNAELTYQAKQIKKKNATSLSYKTILIGLVTMLVLSLFLLIFSMVRNVNKLAETMLKNNKNNTI